MKLNKYLLGLLIVPALVLAGCSDYEDSEIASPQADADALGANFSAAATPVIAHPDDTSFELTLNRVNTKEAVTVPVTVVSCSEISAGIKFCEQPTAFMFAAGEAKASVKLNFNPNCKFQKTYRMALTIGDEKDNPYAAGTASTTVSFSIDYIWKSLAQPVILETGWANSGMLDLIEWASDYKDEATDNLLFRIKSLYENAHIKPDVALGEKEEADEYTPAAPGHLQFILDKNYQYVSMFTSTPEGYNPQSINTGILQNEKTGNYFFMNVKEGKTSGTTYSFTYDVFYKDGNIDKNKAEDVMASFTFDFEKTMKPILKK